MITVLLFSFLILPKLLVQQKLLVLLVSILQLQFSHFLLLFLENRVLVRAVSLETLLASLVRLASSCSTLDGRCQLWVDRDSMVIIILVTAALCLDLINSVLEEFLLVAAELLDELLSSVPVDDSLVGDIVRHPWQETLVEVDKLVKTALCDIEGW